MGIRKNKVSYLEFIKVISDKFRTGFIDLNNFELSDDNTKKIEFMFDELENFIDEQKKGIIENKESYFKM